MANIKLDEEQIEQIEGFLQQRFQELYDGRKSIDDSILEEMELYNDTDADIESLPEWKEKGTIPYQYTIVQTMVARIRQTLFGHDNYLKIYVESSRYKNMEEDLQKWLQDELDKVKFRSRSRDFLEDSLTQRTSWIHLRPTFDDKSNIKTVNFNIYNWFDVWFDTKARTTDDTDFMIRKIFRFYEIEDTKKLYIDGQIDKLYETQLPDDDYYRDEIFRHKHGEDYYDSSGSDTVDIVEFIEYYGVYDMSFGEGDKRDFKEVIFTLANRKVLVRAETVELKTKKKRLFFPIRALKQPHSMIGKSIPQVTKKLQKKLNYAFSHLITNYRLNTGLMYKYKKDAGINMSELFAAEGNAVGYEESPDDISIFETPNVVQLGMAMISQIIQLMQQLTGAVDNVLGTSMGRGQTETASGIKMITDQAMFKFQMMAENIADDIIEMIHYIIVLWVKYGKSDVLIDYPSLVDYFNLSEEDIESSRIIDISLNDLSARRDVERSQFLQAINILGGMVQGINGNMPAFLKSIMKNLKMDDVDKILEGAMTQEEMQKKAIQQLMMMMVEQQMKQAKANPNQSAAVSMASPEESAGQVNAEV